MTLSTGSASTRTSTSGSTFENERPWRTRLGMTSGGTDQQKITSTQINNDLMLTRGQPKSHRRERLHRERVDRQQREHAGEQRSARRAAPT